MSRGNVVEAGRAMLVGSIISRGISLLSSIVLARLLFEGDYSALLIASIVTGFLVQIGSMGYEVYYLQFKGSAEEKQQVLQQVYALRIMTNAAMFVAQFVAGAYISLYTRHTMGGQIVMLMAFSFLAEGFSVPAETVLRQEMRFNVLAKANVTKEILASLARIGAACAGLGGLAFALGVIMGSVVKFFFLLGYRPSGLKIFSWDKLLAKKIFRFSRHVLAGSAGMYILQQTDKIFLGLWFPKVLTGRYAFAWGNAGMPFELLITPQQQVVLSYVARHQPGEPVLYEKLSTVCRLILILFFPVISFALLFTPEIIQLVVGEKWLSTVPYIRIILCYYFVYALYFPFTSLLTGLGAPHKVTIITVIKAAAIATGLLTTIYLAGKDILLYLLVFCAINLFLDFFKTSWGIARTGTSLKKVLTTSRVEIACVVLMGLIALACLKDFALFHRLGILAASLSVVAGLMLAADGTQTKKAWQLIGKKMFTLRTPSFLNFSFFNRSN